MSVMGGFLELIGIAMMFPLIILLVSPQNQKAKIITDAIQTYFPDITYMQIALLLCFLMVFVFLFKNFYMIYYIKLQNEFVSKWSNYVNSLLIKRLLFAPYKDTRKISPADKHTLLYSSVRDISLDFVLRCIILLANFVVGVCILSLLFYKFTIPAFLSVVFILLFAYFENKYFKNKAKKLGDIGIKLLSDFSYDIDLIIKSEKEIRISNREEYFIERLIQSSSNISSNFSKRISYGNYPLHVTEIGVILSFLIMILSIVFIDKIPKEEIVSSVAVIALIVLRFVPELNKILISLYTINTSKTKVLWFLNKYDEILKFERIKPDTKEKMKFEDSLELSCVGFSYGENKGIFDINLEIKKGEIVGIIGLSGAGKSTLADIISGIYIKDKGTIKVDGTEINEDNLYSWQKNISFLQQSPVLINDSILKNVAFGIEDSKINISKVQDSLKMAGINIEDVFKKPDLSIGQRQRVALARAYYNDFELLILDEATSSLDPKTEFEVTDNIFALKGKKTVIIIAHRLSTLKECDRIIYMKEGKIQDISTFDTLRQKYKEIEDMIKLSSFE